MAKGKNDPTRDNDYLEQLQWQSQHRRRIPIRFQPKWRYKIIYHFSQTTPSGRILQTGTILGLVFLIYEIFSSDVFTESLQAKIFYSAALGLMALIIFLAIRDGTKHKHHKDQSRNKDS